MIVDERMVTFINSLDEGHTEFLEQLEKEAREDAVPIVRREMQSIFKVSDGSCQTETDSGGGHCSWFFCLVDV